MSNMKKFAEHIIAVANNNSYGITNLQLQKVMYFSIKRVDADNSFLENLYDEPFKVWRYGPVVSSVYDEYKKFGAGIIRSSGNFDEKYKIFNDEISNLLKVPVWDLVSDSHKEKKWKDNKSKIVLSISDVEYSLKDVRNNNENKMS